jgi:hypothetical protein
MKLAAAGADIYAAVSDGVDDQQVRWTDPAPYRRGQIGLCTWHGSHTRFTSLAMEPVPQAASED